MVGSGSIGAGFGERERILGKETKRERERGKRGDKEKEKVSGLSGFKTQIFTLFRFFFHNNISSFTYFNPYFRYLISTTQKWTFESNF